LFGQEGIGDLKLKKNDLDKYKVGDFIKIKTTIKDNFERIVHKDYEDEHEIKLLQVIAKYHLHKDLPPYYMVLVDPNMIGWTISRSHALYYDLNHDLLGYKFYDVYEDLIIE